MWFPKRLVPILAIASIAVDGGWLFAKDATAPDVVLASPGGAAMSIPAPFSEELPVRNQVQAESIVLHAQGTWQDPPPGAEAVPAWTPIPPWYPPYDMARYRDARRSMHGVPRDRDHRRSTSWFDSICPSPKRRRAWPGQRGYSRQMEQLDRWEYPDAFMGQPPFGYAGPSRWQPGIDSGR